MPTTLAALARLVGGELLGDGALEICGAATLIDAAGGDITLVDRNEKAERLAAAKARAAVVPRGFPVEALTMPAIVVEDVHRAFTAIVMHFRPPASRTAGASAQSPLSIRRPGLAPTSTFMPGPRSTSMSRSAPARPFIRRADHGRLQTWPKRRGASQCRALRKHDHRGPLASIHAGVVLGCHGFGYRVFEGATCPRPSWDTCRSAQTCEIGACTTIDRGTYGPTIIGDGTKIDNLVMIAHNCRIGKHNMICSQVGVAGSTITGDHVVMAGQVGVRDHVRIGDRAILGAKAGVSHDVPADAHVFGIPAIAERDQKIQFAAISKLPEMRRQLKALQQAVDELTRAEGRRGPCRVTATGRRFAWGNCAHVRHWFNAVGSFFRCRRVRQAPASRPDRRLGSLSDRRGPGPGRQRSGGVLPGHQGPCRSGLGRDLP